MARAPARPRRAPRPRRRSCGGAQHERRDVLLRGRDITRRWGGLVAVDKVSIELERGTVHAVIGTNGAGKSTLINILSGEIAAVGGAVELLGEDVTRWPQPRRARAGLGRSYQRNTIFPQLHGARELPPRGAGARASGRGAGGRPPAPAPSARRGARRGRARRPDRLLDAPRRPAVARPEAATGDRDVPGHRAAGAAARRAAGRHGRRGDRAHAGAAGASCEPATPSCSSSTTWTRCSASPTASP